jgi:type IV pilus assembly protein PilB
MAVLTKEAETRILDLLLAEGLVDPTFANNARNSTDGGPILDKLISQHAITDDMVAHATAIIIGVPYVELKNITIDQDILVKIPYETQSRFMVIPLGDKDGMLNIAMSDVTNVQATDYISNLINQPVRVWMSSERGIKEMLEKNHGDFSGVKEAVKDTNEEIAEKAQRADVKTIVQDSPISKALTMLGVNEEQSLVDACKIEHDISEETFAKLKEFVKKHEQ